MNEKNEKSDKPCFTNKMLLELAKDQRKASYAKYSDFTVGAALRGESGTTYFGCNVENASFPVGICAERSAAASAISHGEKKITVIAIAGGPKDSPPSGELRPCGMCLQFLSEFMDKDGKIIIADGENGFIETTLGELLPGAFRLTQ
ncbi:MAG: cytidine deaminase [bacterium]